jgi:hypothetical protein
VVDRRFWIANGRRVEFEAAFGVGGAWPRLLSRADGYLRTEMCCESPESAQYRVRDFWSWHRNFEVFREQFQAGIESFEIWLRPESVIEKEQFLGAYYERFDNGGEQDLVLS